MKYLMFSRSGEARPRLGFLRGARVIEAKRFGSLLDLIDAGPDAWTWMAARAHDTPDTGHALEEIRCHAPIPRPRKNIVCAAGNYWSLLNEAAAARGRAPSRPEEPIFFTKAPTSVNGPYDSVAWDACATQEVDYEVELGVVIGIGGRNISRTESLDHVFGYTIVNDMSARDLQRKHVQCFKAKSLDGFCPMGPYVVTADEFGDPQDKRIGLRLNGEVKQCTTTADMVFPVAVIIEALSRGTTIDPGDVVATGTPGGVGLWRTPPAFMRDGDVMEAEIEGIGMLRNRLAATAVPACAAGAASLG